MNYYQLEAKYGTHGAERICTLAEQFTNHVRCDETSHAAGSYKHGFRCRQVRVKMSTAIAWAIAQYEQSLETTQGKG